MDEAMFRNRKPRDEGTADLPMFAPLAVPAQRHSPTSVAAGEKMAKKAPGKREQVLRYICEYTETHRHGPTDPEIIDHFEAKGWSRDTPRARRVDLFIGVKDKVTGKRIGGGYVEASGERDGRTEWVPTAAKGWPWWQTQVHGAESTHHTDEAA